MSPTYRTWRQAVAASRREALRTGRGRIILVRLGDIIRRFLVRP